MQQQPGKRVAFSAGLGQTFTAPTSGQWHDVKYCKVTLNHGGCYNPETGEFKVHVPGVYLITTTSHISGLRGLMRLINRPSSGGAYEVEVVLATSDTYTGPWAPDAPASGGFSATMTVPVQLSHGDRVLIQLSEGGKIYDSDGSFYSTFSAVLMYEV